MNYGLSTELSNPFRMMFMTQIASVSLLECALTKKMGGGGKRPSTEERLATRSYQLFSVRPAKEDAARGVSSADGDEQQQIALFQAALFESVAESERDCAGGGISVAINVDEDF